jgi:hypothetical protein
MKQDENNKREFSDLTDEEKKMLHEFLLNIVKNPPAQITEVLSRLEDMEKDETLLQELRDKIIKDHG